MLVENILNWLYPQSYSRNKTISLYVQGTRRKKTGVLRLITKEAATILLY